jgi:hypothetical protein
MKWFFTSVPALFFDYKNYLKLSQILENKKRRTKTSHLLLGFSYVFSFRLRYLQGIDTVLICLTVFYDEAFLYYALLPSTCFLLMHLFSLVQENASAVSRP